MLGEKGLNVNSGVGDIQSLHSGPRHAVEVWDTGASGNWEGTETQDWEMDAYLMGEKARARE